MTRTCAGALCEESAGRGFHVSLDKDNMAKPQLCAAEKGSYASTLDSRGQNTALWVIPR